MPRSDDVLAALYRLHAEIDAVAEALAARHATRFKCRRGCASCCVDGISVYEIEAERIAAHHEALLAHGGPHPPGRCAFLGPGDACRIYADRPYVCRTQGLPLAWHEETTDGGLVQLRDICPLNDEGPPLEGLPEADCWLLGPYEGRLAELERAAASGGPVRRTLRSLFRGA